MSQANPNPNPSQPNKDKEKDKDLSHAPANPPEQPQGNTPGGDQKPPEPPGGDQKPPEPPREEPKVEKKETHFFGNHDHKREHRLPLDWKDKIVVNQVKVRSVEGNVVELENTRQIQTYDPEYYERLMKMEPDFFAEAKMRVKVLHDPRIEK